jgi:hypothetical protein
VTLTGPARDNFLFFVAKNVNHDSKRVRTV